MQLFKFYASLYQISFLYSVARMNQPRYVIHDSLVACNLLHDGTTQGTKKSAVIFPCISDNVSSTVKSVIHFECSVQLVARMNQPRCVIHDSLVACISMHDQTTHGTKQSAVIFACVFSNNALSTVKSVIYFECSVQLVARIMNPDT